MNAAEPGRLPLILAGIAIAALVGTVALYLSGPPSAPAPEAAGAPAPQALRPSVDCAFHDMMRTHAVVSFYFDVARTPGEAPRFLERAIVAEDGTRSNFEGDQRPVWTYALDEDGKPTLTSPDGAVRIVLYGLQLGSPGTLHIEAGIRSNVYRNLGGECRLTGLGSVAP